MKPGGKRPRVRGGTPTGPTPAPGTVANSAATNLTPSGGGGRGARPLSRKGVLFTLIGLLLSGLFILMFSTQIRIPRDAKTSLIAHEADQLYSYSQDLEAYAEDIVALTAKKALIGLVDFFQNATPPRTLKEAECVFRQMMAEGNASYPKLANMRADAAFSITINNREAAPNPGGTNSDRVRVGNLQADTETREAAFQLFRVSETGLASQLRLDAQSNPLGRSLKISIFELPPSGCLQELSQPIFTSVEQIENPGYESIVRTPTNLFMDTDPVYVLLLESPDAGPGEYVQVDATDLAEEEGLIDLTIFGGNATRRTGNWHTVSPHLENDTIKSYMDRMDAFSRSALGIKTNYTIRNINWTQALPFEVKVRADLTYRLYNPYASYAFDSDTEVVVSLEGVPDPLFAYNHFYNKTIKKSAYENDLDYDLVKFTQFHEQGWYRYNNNASSFFLRLLNSTNASNCCGIESTVDVLRIPYDFSATDLDPANDGGHAHPDYSNLSNAATTINYDPSAPAGPEDERPNYINASYFDYLFFATNPDGIHTDFGCNRSFSFNRTALQQDPDQAIRDLLPSWDRSYTMYTPLPDDYHIKANWATWDIHHLTELNIPPKYWMTVCRCGDDDPLTPEVCPDGSV